MSNTVTPTPPIMPLPTYNNKRWRRQRPPPPQPLQQWGVGGCSDDTQRNRPAMSMFFPPVQTFDFLGS